MIFEPSLAAMMHIYQLSVAFSSCFHILMSFSEYFRSYSTYVTNFIIQCSYHYSNQYHFSSSLDAILTMKKIYKFLYVHFLYFVKFLISCFSYNRIWKLEINVHNENLAQLDMSSMKKIIFFKLVD